MADDEDDDDDDQGPVAHSRIYLILFLYLSEKPPQTETSNNSTADYTLSHYLSICDHSFSSFCINYLGDIATNKQTHRAREKRNKLTRIKS